MKLEAGQAKTCSSRNGRSYYWGYGKRAPCIIGIKYISDAERWLFDPLCPGWPRKE